MADQTANSDIVRVLRAEVVRTATVRVRRDQTREWIRYGGRKFSCSPEMARIFLKHAREVIECGEEQLVPLLHSGGIELLLISRATPYSLLDVDVDADGDVDDDPDAPVPADKRAAS